MWAFSVRIVCYEIQLIRKVELPTHVHIGCNRRLSFRMCLLQALLQDVFTGRLSCRMCLLQALLQDVFTAGSPARCVYCRFSCKICLLQALRQDVFTAGSAAGCVYCRLSCRMHLLQALLQDVFTAVRCELLLAFQRAATQWKLMTEVMRHSTLFVCSTKIWFDTSGFFFCGL